MKVFGGTPSPILLALLRDDELKVANLGDANFIFIEMGSFTIGLNQCNSENFPFQLGAIEGDEPADAKLWNFKVKEDDAVVLISDGVSDNYTRIEHYAQSDYPSSFIESIASVAYGYSHYPVGNRTMLLQ